MVCNIYDIITISETFLSDNSSVDLNLPGYQTVIRRDRPTFGGGLAVYIKDNLIYRRRIDLESTSLENIWIEVSTREGKLLICTIYRPPNSNAFWDDFELNIEMVKETCRKSNLIIMGDINADLNTSNGKKLLDICQSQNLSHHINEPTRITDTTASCLDQILTNIPSLVTSTSVEAPICNNDHCTVGINVAFNIPKERNFFRHIWLYEKCDISGFRNALLSFNWDTCFSNKSVNEAAGMWTEAFLNIARTFIPNRVVLIRKNDLPWYSAELRRMKRIMLRVFRKAKRTMSEYHWGRYKELKKEYKEKLETAEKEYYKEKNESLASSSTRNSKSWWETVNNILGRQKNDSYPPMLDESNNTFVGEHAQKAKLFNQFFLSHNRVDSSNVNIPVNEVNENIPTLENIIATEQEVLDYIVNIDANKATGHDGDKSSLTQNS